MSMDDQMRTPRYTLVTEHDHEYPSLRVTTMITPSYSWLKSLWPTRRSSVVRLDFRYSSWLLLDIGIAMDFGTGGDGVSIERSPLPMGFRS
ncbi:hypothetical protein VN97_g5068 [Penicillium thymicola]|uniref:Uncharacterized protein n=1 Tax=Penicillium thymicola TaxID=293382 RepID=A0AAI9TK24_PENTH|nr:hypothetical protein VN97_g5068 [Penicillium thymicola]